MIPTAETLADTAPHGVREALTRLADELQKPIPALQDMQAGARAAWLFATRPLISTAEILEVLWFCNAERAALRTLHALHEQDVLQPVVRAAEDAFEAVCAMVDAMRATAERAAPTVDQRRLSSKPPADPLRAAAMAVLAAYDAEENVDPAPLMDALRKALAA